MASVILATAGTPASAQGAPDHGAGHGVPDAPAASAGAQAVTITRGAYSPRRLSALVGDSVVWRNEDYVAHSVTSPGGGILSGVMSRGGRYSHRFADVGSYPYLCTLHPYMTGQVDVHPALLEAAAGSVLAGQEVELHGRGPAAGSMTIEQRPAGAAGFTTVTSLPAGADGRFHATVRPQTTTAYRAVSPRGPSPAVTVGVASRLRVTLTARRSRRFTRLRVRAAGASHARVTLQRYSRERFSWLNRRRGRLDAGGRAMFRLPTGRPHRVRVVIVGAAGVELGASSPVRLPR